MTSRQTTIKELLIEASNLLQQRSETPALDSQLLLALILDKSRTWILAHADEFVSHEKTVAYHYLLAQRAKGMPLPYLLGEWEFFGRKYRVNPAVLIPRPETEAMVEIAVKWIQQHPGPVSILDVGTGSGCVAISIALECPDARVVGIDISLEALEVASSNGRQLSARNVKWESSDLLSGLPDSVFPVDIICANLPYIPTMTWQNLEVAQYEPRLALDGGLDGLHLIRRLLKEAEEKMRAGGLILLEIESTQGQAAPILARKYFPAANIKVIEDLAGHPRFVQINI